MTTAVLIGAGMNVYPHLIRTLKHIRRFIYIDSLPLTNKPGVYTLSYLLRQQKYFDWRFKVLHKVMKRCGFTYPDTAKPTSPFNITYKNTEYDSEIVYHFNTAFPTDVGEELKRELGESDTLIITAQFCPHESILEMMKKPTHIVFWKDLANDDETNEKNTVIERLHNSMTDIASITFYKKEYVPISFDDIAGLRPHTTQR